MIVGIVYLIIILFFIRLNGLFGLFKDDVLNSKILARVFLFKAMAIPAMYLLYWRFYGGLESFDAGVFYHDASELQRFALKHPFEYLKTMLGLQNDLPGSFFFENYIKKTYNWDNGRIARLFYNDNRVVIRLHSLIHFFAFQSYFVHALLSCLLSYIGIFWMYRSLKHHFIGKEIYLLLVFSFFPALWIHTGALLKEGIAIFVMGGMVFSIYKLLNTKISLRSIVVVTVCFFFCLLLKPYLLLYATLCFSLFFVLDKFKYKYLSFIFVVCLGGTLFFLNLAVLLKFNKTLYEIANMRQVVFSDAAKGGIFLTDSIKFIRLEYDTNLISELSNKKGFYRIKKNVPYMFWEHTHQQDTMICHKNTDTNSVYQLAYTMPESKSNLDYAKSKSSLGLSILNGFYYTLCYPLFFNAGSVPLYLASFENLVLVLALLISILGLIFCKRPTLLVVVFLSFALGECLLIAFTSPNTGAIVRYRAPAVVFILLCAVYYLFDLKKLLTEKFQRK